jgi:hypothetical protein
MKNMARNIGAKFQKFLYQKFQFFSYEFSIKSSAKSEWEL